MQEHNPRLPHSAFRGQTPDEMDFGTGETIPERLATEREAARRRRVEFNRGTKCATCESLVAITDRLRCLPNRHASVGSTTHAAVES